MNRSEHIGTRTGFEDPRPLRRLVGDLSTETRHLVQQEVQLARAEVTEKLEAIQRSSLHFAIAAGLGLAALLTLIAALNTGLTALLAQWLTLDVAVWLAPLVLALVLGAAAYAAFGRGRGILQRERMSLDRTAASLREDRRWIEEKVT